MAEELRDINQVEMSSSLEVDDLQSQYSHYVIVVENYLVARLMPPVLLFQTPRHKIDQN